MIFWKDVYLWNKSLYNHPLMLNEIFISVYMSPREPLINLAIYINTGLRAALKLFRKFLINHSYVIRLIWCSSKDFGMASVSESSWHLDVYQCDGILFSSI